MRLCSNHTGPTTEARDKRNLNTIARAALCIMGRTLRAGGNGIIYTLGHPPFGNPAAMEAAVGVAVAYYRSHIPPATINIDLIPEALYSAHRELLRERLSVCHARGAHGCNYCTKQTGCLRTTNAYID